MTAPTDSTDRITTGSWEYRHVALFPNDTYVRHAVVLGVDAYGWEFEILPSGYTATQPGYRAGDRVYISHARGVILAELDDA